MPSRQIQNSAERREKRKIQEELTLNPAYQLWLNATAIQKRLPHPSGWLRVMRNSRGIKVPMLAEICVLATGVLHWTSCQGEGYAPSSLSELHEAFHRFFGNGYHQRKKHLGFGTHPELDYIEPIWRIALHESPQLQLKALNRLREIDGHSHQCEITHVSGPIIQQLLEGSNSKPPRCLLSRRCRLSTPLQKEEWYHQRSQEELSTELTSVLSGKGESLHSWFHRRASKTHIGTCTTVPDKAPALTGRSIPRTRGTHSSRSERSNHHPHNVRRASSSRRNTSTVSVPAERSIASTGAPLSQPPRPTDVTPSMQPPTSGRPRQKMARHDAESVVTTGVYSSALNTRVAHRIPSTHGVPIRSELSDARSKSTSGVRSRITGPAEPIPWRSSSRGKTGRESCKVVSNQPGRELEGRPPSEVRRAGSQLSSVGVRNPGSRQTPSAKTRPPLTPIVTAVPLTGSNDYDIRAGPAAREIARPDSPTTDLGPYRKRNRRTRETQRVSRDMPRPDSPTLSPPLSPVSPTMSDPMSIASSIRHTDIHGPNSIASQRHGTHIRREATLMTLRPASSVTSLQRSGGSSAGEDPFPDIDYETARDLFPKPSTTSAKLGSQIQSTRKDRERAR